jgi:hypothetical protein
MQSILDKIKKIEALINGTNIAGEQQAAIEALKRLQNRMGELPPQQIGAVEYTLHTTDHWHKRLLLALCGKYQIKPYRYHRQKYTTVMIRVNPQFIDEVLWPEYLLYSKHLEALVEDITSDLIQKIHAVAEEKDISELDSGTQ